MIIGEDEVILLYDSEHHDAAASYSFTNIRLFLANDY